MTERLNERLTGDYRKYSKNYLGHWDVPGGTNYVYTIDHCEMREIRNQSGTKIETVMIFREPIKPLILNGKNKKSIKKALGSANFEDWEGKQIALFEDKVPMAEDGLAIRIREYAPRPSDPICEDCGNPVKDAEIGGKTYRAKAVAENTRTKFGRILCAECAKKAKEAADGAEQ